MKELPFIPRYSMTGSESSQRLTDDQPLSTAHLHARVGGVHADGSPVRVGFESQRSQFRVREGGAAAPQSHSKMRKLILGGCFVRFSEKKTIYLKIALT